MSGASDSQGFQQRFPQAFEQSLWKLPIVLQNSGIHLLMKRKAKDPAAVALGKRRQASMTPEERRAFVELGGAAAAEANRRRSPLERRMIAQKANRTRRLNPPWLRAAAAPAVAPGAPADASNAVEKQEARPDLAELAALIDAADDAAIAALDARMRGK